MQLEISCSTYTPEAVQALKKLYKLVKSAISETQTETDKVKRSLGEYERVGSAMDEVAKEFARLKEQIEGKKWALKELHQENR